MLPALVTQNLLKPPILATDSVILKIQSLFTIGAIVLVLSLVTGYIFTSRKAKKQNLNVWDSTHQKNGR